jgi:hypothetical protein
MVSSKVRWALSAAFAGLFVAATAADAAAETRWQQNHPRRVEVNRRLNNLNRRIDQERREGEIGRGQARAMHGEVHQLRREERGDARFDNSHITRPEQGALNRQENAISNQIGR